MSAELTGIVNAQIKLMKMLGLHLGPQFSSKKLVPALSMQYLEAASGIVCEAAEVLELTTKMTRPWKATVLAEQKDRYEAIVEEVIDVLLYSVELLVHLGLDSEDIAKAYNRKVGIVMARIINARYSPEQIMEAAVGFNNEEGEKDVHTLLEHMRTTCPKDGLLSVEALANNPVATVKAFYAEEPK